MVKQHKKQHFIPQSYLASWCDPTTPKGQEPFVWIFTKDGRTSNNKAPSNIFYENDMYTIKTTDGKRILRLEKSLAQLESLFCSLRDKKILTQKTLNHNDRFLICIFMAAMHNRTAAHRDFHKEQFGHIVKIGNQMKEALKSASKQEIEAMKRSSGLSGEGPSIALEEMRQVAEEPLQKLLGIQIQTEGPLIYKLDMAILQTSNDIGFITSDNPCVWRDPEAYKRPPVYRNPALCYKSIEILFPISPDYCVLLNRVGVSGYREANEQLVDQINRSIALACDQSFIVNSNETKPIWLDPGKEPLDSLEKIQAKTKKVK